MDTVIFKIDRKLKKAAEKKAKEDNISLSDLYRTTTQSYIQGELKVGIIHTPKLKASVIKSLKKASEDFKKGRNISPTFKNVADMMKYLES